jgi:hypothetical protein
MSEFINVSAVKKLVKAHDRQCSPCFLNALDAYVSAKIRGACEVHNGGAKRLDGAVLTLSLAAPVKTASKPLVDNSELRADIQKELVIMELQINVLTKQEFLARLSKIKSLLI